MQGLSAEQARAAFWVIDKDGLVTSQRSSLSEYVQPFARTEPDERDGEDLLSLVKRVKPTVLVFPGVFEPRHEPCAGTRLACCASVGSSATVELCGRRPR